MAQEDQQCEAEVNAIYAVRDQMSALDTPIEERLNKPTRVIRRWIERAQPLVQQTLRKKNGHRDIRSFFTDTQR